MRTLWSWLTALAFGSVAIATLAALFADHHWFLELFSHFRVQYVTLILLLLAILASVGRWLLVALLLPLLAINLVPLLPYLGAQTGATDAAGTVKLATINLLKTNQNTRRLVDLLGEEEPDVVMLQEFTPRWAEAIEPALARYRHRIFVPQEGAFGIGLLSVYPIAAQEIARLSNDFPAVRATLQVGAQQLTVLGAHPSPPTRADWAALRNQQLVAMARLAAAADAPLVILADLNTTPWSPHFQRLLTTTGLRDAGRGGGLDFTWPTFMPLLGIPIDHCLVSEQLTVVDHYRGESIGSDHYPLFVKLAL